MNKSKSKIKKGNRQITLAEVIKEMDKPRVTKSAREQSHIDRNEGLVVKHNIQK